MPHDSEMTPQDDIQQALDSAHKLENAEHHPHADQVHAPSDTLVHRGEHPALFAMRFGLMRCGIMAQRYPWQATALLMVTIGCGWLCSYFGWTVLAALVLYAANTED